MGLNLFRFSVFELYFVLFSKYFVLFFSNLKSSIWLYLSDQPKIMSSRLKRSKVQKRRFEPEKGLHARKNNLEPRLKCSTATILSSWRFLKEKHSRMQARTSRSCVQIPVSWWKTYIQRARSRLPHQLLCTNIQVEFQIHPTQWQVLGFIDAEITENYIDNSEIQTHKRCIHPNFEAFINKTRTKSLFDLVLRSYLQTLDHADIVPTESFSNNNSLTEMAVLTRGKVKPKILLTGLKGFLAKISENELQEDMSFSVFAPTSNYKQTRSMLGPASFVNSDCNPNVRFILEGEKSASSVAIQSIKTIGAGEEITVNYGEKYFGDDNKNCRCVGCQQASS